MSKWSTPEYRAYHRERMRKVRSSDSEQAKKLREYQAAYQRKYYAENTELVTQKNEAWRKNNPEKSRAIRSRRKALIRGASVGDVDLPALVSSWDKLCGICKELVEGAYEIDHIFPLSKGGLHTQSNLQLTHSRCNRVKGAS